MEAIILSLTNLSQQFLQKLGQIIWPLLTVFSLGTQFFYQFQTRPLLIEIYPRSVVNDLWIDYRNQIQRDGRTIDRTLNYITTSEGQSYSLLRAVWMDDKETFDRVWRWTKNNLAQRPGDHLFAWLWGQRPNGEWNILYEEGGINSATDADQDIALALIFAYSRWNDDQYLEQARQILADIWRVEVLEINGEPYLLAGNWGREQKYPLINPSYFTFYAYPIFAAVDPQRDWLKLKENSYRILNAATELPLDQKKSAFLPPDWISIDRQNGNILPPQSRGKSTAFADDAIRVIWRVALDWQWHRDPAALAYLKKLDFLAQEWQKQGLIYARYRHDGLVERDHESYSLYGAVIGYFTLVKPELAPAVYYRKIIPLINVDQGTWREKLGYYSQNWVWFGLALYHHLLPNLFSPALKQ